jgi:hypothetical protein
MAKFYGPIGYVEQVEDPESSGVWKDKAIERTYSGDVIKTTSRVQSGEHLNDDLTIDNRISVVGDPFAYEKFHAMRYIKWMGANWKITSVEVQRPRLILTIGGVYNGPTAPVAPAAEEPSWE